ncbi:hypothetical protein T4E_143 [Trichinella pseudospiralis]|uniref:Uncharacterized protein n=1 Tax=Trichinella pseudospiralis TaxID=6337 RepID=A0A0V0Y3I2_TRIPS|nr:hypothetical protein T4E_143 [Trichinella pseudospiralis]
MKELIRISLKMSLTMERTEHAETSEYFEMFRKINAPALPGGFLLCNRHTFASLALNDVYLVA